MKLAQEKCLVLMRVDGISSMGLDIGRYGSDVNLDMFGDAAFVSDERDNVSICVQVDVVDVSYRTADGGEHTTVDGSRVYDSARSRIQQILSVVSIWSVLSNFTYYMPCLSNESFSRNKSINLMWCDRYSGNINGRYISTVSKERSITIATFFEAKQNPVFANLLAISRSYGSPRGSLGERMLLVLERFQTVSHINNISSQILGYTACLELILFPTRNSKYDILQKRLCSLIGNDLVEATRVKETLVARHKYAHNGFECTDIVLCNMSSMSAIACILAVSEKIYEYPTHGQLIDAIDNTQFPLMSAQAMNLVHALIDKVVEDEKSDAFYRV